MSGARLSMEISPELVDAIAERVVERLANASGSVEKSAEWLDVERAAEYLACEPRRIYDLKALGRLRYGKDGSRLLFRREWLDECVSTSD